MFDESEQEISRALQVDLAVANARINILSGKPHHELTLEEFSEIALIVRVRAGQGKWGFATTGKTSYLIDDRFDWADNIFAMRAEASRCYTKGGYALPRDQWESQFIDGILTYHGVCDVITTSAVGIGRPFVLVNTGSVAASLNKDNLLRLCYDQYSAPVSEPTSSPQTKKMSA